MADDSSTCQKRYAPDLARKNGYAVGLQVRGAELMDALSAFFSDYTPAAALLHGDLWSGNAAADESGDLASSIPRCARQKWRLSGA
jgi:fructosamine-3-kinase